MLQRGDRRIKKTESVADFFRRGDSDGRGSRSCSSETRLRQAVLFNVLPRVYRRDFRIVGIPPVFPATDFRRAVAASYRSSVFYRILSSGGVSAGVFQRIYVRHRYRDSSFFALPTALLTFALLAIACTLGGEICKKRPPACGNGGIFCSFLLLLIGATACALAEILLVTIIFRPVSKIF